MQAEVYPDSVSDRGVFFLMIYFKSCLLNNSSIMSKNLLNLKVFACDAACLNLPIAVGRSSVHIPIKITKPATPILYISHNRNHLEQLRGTIHVVEVMVFVVIAQLVLLKARNGF